MKNKKKNNIDKKKNLHPSLKLQHRLYNKQLQTNKKRQVEYRYMGKETEYIAFKKKTTVCVAFSRGIFFSWIFFLCQKKKKDPSTK